MTLFPLGELIFIVSVIAFGAVVQGLTGFGLGLVAAPLLVFVNPELVPIPILIANLIFTILVTYSDRKGIHLIKLGWAIAGRLLGTFLGAGMMVYLSRNGIALFLGISVLVAVLLNTFGLRIDYNRRNLTIAGILSGFTATITSIGGPFVALVYQDQSAATIRGNMSGLFLVGSFFSLASLFLVGRFSWDELMLSVYMIPGVLVGFGLSQLTKHWVAPHFLRPLILILCGVSGIVMLFKALL